MNMSVYTSVYVDGDDGKQSRGRKNEDIGFKFIKNAKTHFAALKMDQIDQDARPQNNTT